MKRNVKAYLFKWFKKTVKDDEDTSQRLGVLDPWPDIKLCVEVYYKNHPEMRQYHYKINQPIEFECTEGFSRSLSKNCKTKTLRIKLIDALTKVVYKIPSGGLHDTPIKERADLWHFYVSDAWRVFYRKKNNYMVLEEFCSHKKLLYYRRH
ncbi:MAG: hypothetical protein WBB37_03180 [bacterium]